MDFRLSEEQLAIKEAVRKFAVNEKLLEVAREHDEAEAYPIELHKKLAEIGWLGACIPEEYGGSGGVFMDLFVLVEALSREALMAGNIVFRNVANAGLSILRHGTDEQKKYFLPGMVSGKFKFAFSLTEPNAGSDAASIVASAEKDGEDYIINGNKVFCTGAGVADYIQFIVRTDKSVPKREGISVFFVDAHPE